MREDKKEYQQIFKATSLFGGVQVLQILFSIIKTKVAAIFLGPSGLGMLRLLKSTVMVTHKLTNFGLPMSAVKFIAAHFTYGDKNKAYRLINILKKLLWLTGLLGAVVLLLISPLISQLLFDSKAYTFSIALVAVAVLFDQLANGGSSILQGLRKLKQLAKANLYGSFLSLLMVAPLYYFFAEKAIVPAIIISSLINFGLSWYFIKTNKIPKIKLTYAEHVSEGKEMFKLGLALSLTGILTAVTAYGLEIYINEMGGVDQVGLFTAGFMVLSTYGSLIFTAMGKDYYPRLSGIATDNTKVRSMVKQQAFIAILIITPIIVLFLAFAPFFIRLLFSAKFLGIEMMISWGIMGLLFKAVSFSLGYVIIAKGDTRIFMISNVAFSLFQLGINMTGYYIGGLTGLGISFLVYYIIHLIAIYLIDYLYYKVYFTKEFYGIFCACILLCGLSFGFTFMANPLLRYTALSVFLIISTLFSYHYLNKKINFVELIKAFLNKGDTDKS